MSTFPVPAANKFTRFPSTALQPAAFLANPFAFDNASWTKTRCSVVAGQADPFGGTLAYSLVEDASNNTHVLQEAITSFTTTLPNRLLIYAKAATRSFFRIGDVTPNMGAYFNLATGAVGTTDPATKAYSTLIGGGWWRFSVEGVKLPNGTFILNMASADNTPSYAGDGASSILIYLAQVQ